MSHKNIVIDHGLEQFQVGQDYELILKDQNVLDEEDFDEPLLEN